MKKIYSTLKRLVYNIPLCMLSLSKYHFFCRLPPTPNRPNLLSPDLDLCGGTATGAGEGATGVSFIGSGGARKRAKSLKAPESRLSPNRPSRPSSRLPLGCCDLLAFSWTLLNFSNSSVQRMPPSSLPFSLLERSKFEGPALEETLYEV